MRIPLLLRYVTCLALPMAAQAALLTINNPSFESPVSAPATFTGGQTFGPTSWTVYNTGDTNGLRYFGVWNPATTGSYLDPVPHGANIGVVFLENVSNIAEAGLRQVLSNTLQVSTQYTLTVEVGNFGPDGIQFDFTGFPGYRVDLLAGTTVIASDNNSLSIAEGRFETSLVSFTTGASHPNLGQPLGIRLVNLNGDGIEVNFDNVQLDAVAVPEPSHLGLLALAGLLRVLTRHSSSSKART